MFLTCLQIADEKIIRSECSQLCSVSPFSCNPPSVLKYVGSLARTLEQASLRAVWWPENPVISSLCGGSMSHPALKMLHSPRWVLLLCIDNEVLAIYDHVSLKVLSHILVRPPPKQRLCFSPFRMELIEPPQSCLHHSPSVSVPCDKAEGVLLSFRDGTYRTSSSQPLSLCTLWQTLKMDLASTLKDPGGPCLVSEILFFFFPW